MLELNRYTEAAEIAQRTDGVVAGIDEPLNTELQFIGESDFRHQHFHQHLAAWHIELAERGEDGFVVGWRSEDQ
jgi:hypothetical protein